MRPRTIFLSTAALIVISSLISCGGKSSTVKLDAEDTFARGMDYFNRKKYVEALDDFKDVVYNYAGTRVAAEASYYLGECYLNTKDYETAIDEYQHLTSDYPSSPFAEKGLYRTAYCYYKMSPNYALDQAETTDKAKATLQLYFERYSDGQQQEDAKKLLLLVNDKLAHKDYESGQIYFKMEQYSSAKIYFEGVAKDYPGTTWAEKSQAMLERLEPLLKSRPVPKKGMAADSTVTDSTK